MKELYIAPELKLVCFAPAQSLANTDPMDIVTVFGLDGSAGGPSEETIESPGNDFGFDF